MKKISSTRRPKIRKFIGGVILLQACVAVYVINIDKLKIFDTTVFVAFSIIISSFAFLRKHQIVYIDKRDFIVKGKKILIKDVISIKQQIILPIYKVTYHDGDKIKSFKFEVDQFMHITPDFIKRLQTLAEKNHV